MRFALLHEFAKETGITEACKRDIRQALKQKVTKEQSVCSDKVSLFAELPKTLKYEISMSMYNGVINKNTLLRDKHPNFIIEVIPMLYYASYKNGDYLYRCGSYPDEVYIIFKGKINLVLENLEIMYK